VSRQRLLLFDVDGTLLSPGPGARRVFAESLVEVFGTCGDLDGYRFEGKLDPGIVAELMLAAGIEDSVVARDARRALDRYVWRLEEALAEERPVLKPGVLPLLDAIEARGDAVLSLLTGNVERGARAKLSAVGIWSRFRFGAWGDERPLRTELGPVALARAREVTGIAFSPADTVVVGDALSDVACGRALGARVVAVATGRTTAADLASAGADVVLTSFADLPAACEAILP
jgi:phosphoglycolate phosphatase-like HAD superfamily hydrolase